MKRAMMEGYIGERKEQRAVNGKIVEIISYNGDHCDEYLM